MKWLNNKYCKSHVLRKIGETVYNFVNKNLCLVIVMAIVGIVMAIVGHYGTMGFDWRWFLFFELPIYVFICWAAYKMIGIYKKSKELECKKIITKKLDTYWYFSYLCTVIQKQDRNDSSIHMERRV